MNKWLLILGLKTFGGLIAIAISGFVLQLLHRLNKKLGLEISLKTEEKINRIVRTVVLELNQVTVDILKKQGKFTGTTQQDILKTAINRVHKRIFNELGINLEDHRIESFIEATIGEIKPKVEGNKGYLIKNSKSTVKKEEQDGKHNQLDSKQ